MSFSTGKWNVKGKEDLEAKDKFISSKCKKRSLLHRYVKCSCIPHLLVKRSMAKSPLVVTEHAGAPSSEGLPFSVCCRYSTTEPIETLTHWIVTDNFIPSGTIFLLHVGHFCIPPAWRSLFIAYKQLEFLDWVLFDTSVHPLRLIWRRA